VQAREKVGVEGEAGYFRRNHWVPVPEAEDLGCKWVKTEIAIIPVLRQDLLRQF
jgi:hypothetical protein